MIVPNIINGGSNNMKQFNLDEYLENPNRKVITRDGHNVRIVCTDCKNYEYPTVALVTYNDDEFVVNCTKEGKCHTPNKYKYDLFFVSEKKEGWVNIYLDVENSSYVETCIYKSKEEAEESGKKWSRYITTVKIEWEE